MLTGYLFQARLTDPTLCAMGPAVIQPPCSTTVLVGFLNAARVLDSDVHQAKIIPPCEITVIIGG